MPTLAMARGPLVAECGVVWAAVAACEAIVGLAATAAVVVGFDSPVERFRSEVAAGVGVGGPPAATTVGAVCSPCVMSVCVRGSSSGGVRSSSAAAAGGAAAAAVAEAAIVFRMMFARGLAPTPGTLDTPTDESTGSDILARHE